MMNDKVILSVTSKDLLTSNYISDIKSELKGEIDIAKRSGDYRRKQAVQRSFNLIEAMEYVLREHGIINGDKELLNNAKKLEDHCKERKTCDKCIFYKNDGENDFCILTGLPNLWDIEKY